MLILGIETSCDETAAAVVRNGREILSSVVFSQIEIHKDFSGVVPELASRAHVGNINEVIGKAVSDAGIKRGLSKIPPVDAIGVTVGPGLAGSLITGVVTAKALSWLWKVPLIGVNHLEGHLYSAMLDHKELDPPFAGLIVSGGHTEIVHVKEHGSYRVMGRTRDDAAGEAFDKVAKLLKLGYPGGPVIEKMAKKGDPFKIKFPRAWLEGGYDFSFSGLKTAVLYYLQNLKKDNEKIPVNDICASFQEAVFDVLINKSLKAADKVKADIITVGGGVSANSTFRSLFEKKAAEAGKEALFSNKRLSTDNAAIIACNAYFKYKSGIFSKQTKLTKIRVDPSQEVRCW